MITRRRASRCDSEIGGRPFKKTVTFMTTHPDLYLRQRCAIFENEVSERTISKRSLFFIPKRAVRRSRIGFNGDPIAITTNKEA
jgi:hypothetical protein